MLFYHKKRLSPYPDWLRVDLPEMYYWTKFLDNVKWRDVRLAPMCRLVAETVTF